MSTSPNKVYTSGINSCAHFYFIIGFRIYSPVSLEEESVGLDFSIGEDIERY